jgi:hypothetical protein
MYGVERSVVALARPDGSADGKTTLDDKGRVGGRGAGVGSVGVGAAGVGVVVFRPGRVALLGRSHAVCGCVSYKIIETLDQQLAPCLCSPGIAFLTRNS